jgi:hypothetical protein
MRRVITGIALMVCAASRGFCGSSDQSFDVSLWSSVTDLSPYYRAVVREATERYRGDLIGELHETVYFGDLGGVGRIPLCTKPDADPFPVELIAVGSALRTVDGSASITLRATPANSR